MYDVQCSGTMSTDGQFSKKVHICYDALAWKADCINVLVQVEPPSILDIANLIRANADKFDLILTWREELLDLPNAQKFIFGCCWIEWDTLIQKTEGLFFNTSDKGWAPGHIRRLQIWEGLREAEECNGFSIVKHQSPPRTPNKNFLFETAKYHIVVENEQRDNWITEKLIDCLASKTIPIYWGASNIGDYFNTEGMIIFNTLEELKDILDNLDEKFYDDRVKVVEENYEKSKEYWDFHARVKHEIAEFIGG